MAIVNPLKPPRTDDPKELRKFMQALADSQSYITYGGNPTNVVSPRWQGDKCYDTSAENWYIAAGLTSADWVATQGGTATIEDLADFSITASKLWLNIPIVQGLTLANDTPSAGYITWSNFDIYYAGVKYSIAGSNSNKKYNYWKDAGASLTKSDTNPSTLSDWDPSADFVIAVNIAGVGQAAWSAIANQVIGAAYIEDLAVVDAKIYSISGTKILASSSIAIGPASTYGSDGIQLEYNAGNPRFYAGDGANAYVKFDGTGVTVRGQITVESGSNVAVGADVTNYADTRVANAIAENSTLRINTPVGAVLKQSGTVVGAIVVHLPQSWTGTMLFFALDVFQYTTNRSFTLYLSGYNYTDSTWYNTTANLVGTTACDNRVRFGHDGTKCCIVVGETTSSWYEAMVSVRNFMAAGANYELDKWDDGWVIDIKSSLAGYTFTSDLADSLIDAATIKSQGALATKSAVSTAECDTTIISGGKIVTGLLTASNIQTGTLNASLVAISNSNLAWLNSTEGAKLTGVATGATNDISLVVRGTGLALTGNSVNRPTGGGSWDSDCYSKDGFTGGAFASFIPTSPAYFMAGLNSDPLTDQSYTSIDYAFFIAGDASLYIFESGVAIGAFGTWAAGDVLAVVYDGLNVRYMQNGTVLRTISAAADLKLFFDSSILYYGINNIRFGPYAMAGSTIISGGYIKTALLTADNITAGTMSGERISASSSIAIGPATTYGTDGIQLEYNSGNPRFYAGNGTDRYIKFDGVDLIVKGRVEIIGDNHDSANMLMNPGFEENLNCWAGVRCATASTGNNSNKCVELTRISSGAYVYQTKPDGSPLRFEVNYGEVYELMADILCDASGVGGYLYAFFYTKDMTDISNINVGTTSQTWIRKRLEIVIPSNCKLFEIYLVADGANGTAYIDNVTLTRIDALANSWAASADRTKIDGGNIHASSSVAIGLGTAWESNGIQAQYNGGVPRFYVGNGTTKYMKWDGSELTVRGKLNGADIDATTITAGKIVSGDLTYTQLAGGAASVTSENTGTTEAAASVVAVGGDKILIIARAGGVAGDANWVSTGGEGTGYWRYDLGTITVNIFRGTSSGTKIATAVIEGRAQFIAPVTAVIDVLASDASGSKTYTATTDGTTCRIEIANLRR